MNLSTRRLAHIVKKIDTYNGNIKRKYKIQDGLTMHYLYKKKKKKKLPRLPSHIYTNNQQKSFIGVQRSQPTVRELRSTYFHLESNKIHQK